MKVLICYELTARTHRGDVVIMPRHGVKELSKLDEASIESALEQLVVDAKNTHPTFKIEDSCVIRSLTKLDR